MHLDARPVSYSKSLCSADLSLQLSGWTDNEQGMETDNANRNNVGIFDEKLKSWFPKKPQTKTVGTSSTVFGKEREAPEVLVDDRSASSKGGSGGQGDSGIHAKRYANRHANE